MGKRKPYDIEAARDEIERLEAQASALEYQMEDETDPVTLNAYRSMINRLIKKASKIRYRIMEEEDAQAQDLFKDREAADKAMEQSNQEAKERWKAEHGDEPCYAEPNKPD